MQRILVAFDGSDGSRRAASFARDMALAFRARLTLLHVIEPFPVNLLAALEARQSELYARQMSEASALVNDLAAELALGDTEQVIEMGYPGDVICREASERDVDLIVVGRRGHRPGSRLLAGSVGAHVLATANRTVTVVH